MRRSLLVVAVGLLAACTQVDSTEYCVETRYGKIPVKVAMDGSTVVNAAPEYEACAAAARQHGVPVKLVFSAALAAYDAHR